MEKLRLEIPQGWEDIKLKDYLELQAELKNYSDDEEAMTAMLFNKLCGLDVQLLPHISIKDYESLKSELAGFMNNVEMPLQRFIQIEGVEYGFEPNLSKMAYGAFLDITQWDTLTIDKNWAKVMSVLYRPVLKKDKVHYSIQPYEGTDNTDKFLELGMHIHFGALFFFVRLLTDLLNGILNSLMGMEDLPPQLKPILEKSGKVMHQSMNSLMGTSYYLTK